MQFSNSLKFVELFIQVFLQANTLNYFKVHIVKRSLFLWMSKN